MKRIENDSLTARVAEKTGLTAKQINDIWWKWYAASFNYSDFCDLVMSGKLTIEAPATKTL